MKCKVRCKKTIDSHISLFGSAHASRMAAIRYGTCFPSSSLPHATTVVVLALLLKYLLPSHQSVQLCRPATTSDHHVGYRWYYCQRQGPSLQLRSVRLRVPLQAVPSLIHILPLSRLTNYPAIANPKLPAEGSASFSNVQLALCVLLFPRVLQALAPWIFRLSNSWTWYFFLVALFGLPVTIAYWTLMSYIGPRVNEKCILPGKGLDGYVTIHDAGLKQKYPFKMPMQVFHDAFFEGKIDFNGDVLEMMEYRHDWATFNFTPEVSYYGPSIAAKPDRSLPVQLFKFVFTNLLPEVIMHSASQDEEQVRDHYDRGDDFYEWFLGPRMIYTSGVISDINVEESLEQLQDNKLALVCEKLALEPTDRLLDIGCGWGTLAAFAGKNYGCDVTGGRSLMLDVSSRF